MMAAYDANQAVVACHQCGDRALTRSRYYGLVIDLPEGWRRLGGRPTCPICAIE